MRKKYETCLLSTALSFVWRPGQKREPSGQTFLTARASGAGR